MSLNVQPNMFCFFSLLQGYGITNLFDTAITV